jgi:hypothetical protein
LQFLQNFTSVIGTIAPKCLRHGLGNSMPTLVQKCFGSGGASPFNPLSGRTIDEPAAGPFLGQGLCLGKKLWTTVGPQNRESLTLVVGGNCSNCSIKINHSIEELDRAVISEAESRPAAVGMMQRSGVGR